MATNDVNLQVINSMTPEKMNSLKDANGKIPSLANQIIMTDEEDVNLSQLRTEVVYDMTSGDVNKNWGYSSGIKAGVTVSGKDFSKYNLIKVYVNYANTVQQIGVIDMNFLVDNQYLIAMRSGTQANNSANFYFCNCSINSSKNSFTHSMNGYIAGTTVNQRPDNKDYVVYKIEGVLKTPAMIYTGAELNAGEGIVINNGALSSNVTRKTLFQGTVSSASEFSLNDTLANYKFILLTAFDNFNNYVTTMIDVSTLRVHSTRTAPIGISSSSSAVDRYAEVYYVNETKLGILTPKNMSLRFVEGIK